MSESKYPKEALGPDDDDGTMPENVEALTDAVVGHRIVKASRERVSVEWYGDTRETEAFVITLDNGKRVILQDTHDCCAGTDLEAFLLHADRVDHIITGVGTTGEYTKWHIFADMGDVLELTVNWSCGNPFYYAYGFNIVVQKEIPGG